MRNYIRKIIYLYVFIGYSFAISGSFDDFFKAIRLDDGNTVQALLQRGFDPNTTDPKGYNPLFLALSESSFKAANALLSSPDTQVDVRNSVDETPLMMAALRGQLALVRLLIEKGADVNKTGWTPLHYAATGGHTEIITLLLENHAYIDAESPNGTTPLMMAAQYGTGAAVQLLLDEGADPMLKNQLNLTALDFAERGQRVDAEAILSRVIQTRPARAP